MWLSLNALGQSAKWTGVSGGQCSQGPQSCQQNLPAVTGKPDSILTSWHFTSSSSQMDEAGISDFKAQLSCAWRNCEQELIHLGSSTSGHIASRGWKQNPPLIWIILGIWSDSSITGVKDMRLWSDSHSFSRGIICFTKVVRKWDPFP